MPITMAKEYNITINYNQMQGFGKGDYIKQITLITFGGAVIEGQQVGIWFLKELSRIRFATKVH